MSVFPGKQNQVPKNIPAPSIVLKKTNHSLKKIKKRVKVDYNESTIAERWKIKIGSPCRWNFSKNYAGL